MRINFDFLDLQAFLAVKETASFHAAAERLNLSQSSVTRRVQKLEEALGTPLFDRTTREVRPTLAGKRLQQRAEAMVQDAQDTTSAMRDEHAAFAHQRSQVITVATVPTVLTGLVGPALRAFRNDGNMARVRLMDLAANEVAEAVAQGEADLGVCSIPMLEPMTEFRLLFSDPIVVALPEGHALAAEQALTWSDLADDALILPMRRTGNRLLIDEALARSKNPMRWTYEVGRSSTALELVAQGFGVAPVPKVAVTGRPTPGVVWRVIGTPEVSRPIGLISRMAQADSSLVAAFKQALVQRCPPA